MKALIIGRFQPFHLGHLEVLKEVDGLGLDGIILGIGTNGGIDKFNPFAYDEVLRMIQPQVEKLTTPVEIYKIPDINNRPNYAKHVQNITGCDEKKTVVVSGNPNTLSCFTGYGNNYQTYIQKMALIQGKDINATFVRDMIAKDQDWKKYVPTSTVSVIENIDGVNRIKGLYR